MNLPTLVTTSFATSTWGAGMKAVVPSVLKTTYEEVGKPISSCNASKGLEKSGWLCYPFCKNNTIPTYYGIGPVCWQHCKEGYVDEGALCRKKGSVSLMLEQLWKRAGYPLTCASEKNTTLDCVTRHVKEDTMGWAPFAGKFAPALIGDSGAICCRNGTICSQKLQNLAGGCQLP